MQPWWRMDVPQFGRKRPRSSRDVLRRVSEAAAFSRLQPSPARPADGAAGRSTAPPLCRHGPDDARALALTSHPFGLNPVPPLAEIIYFDRLARAPILLFITATNVRTGRGRVLPQRGNHPTSFSLRLSATMVPGDRDRRRSYWEPKMAAMPAIRPSHNAPLVRESDSPRHHPGGRSSARTAGIRRRTGKRDPQPGSTRFPSTHVEKNLRNRALRPGGGSGPGEGARWAGMRTHMHLDYKLADFRRLLELNAE